MRALSARLYSYNQHSFYTLGTHFIHFHMNLCMYLVTHFVEYDWVIRPHFVVHNPSRNSFFFSRAKRDAFRVSNCFTVSSLNDSLLIDILCYSDLLGESRTLNSSTKRCFWAISVCSILVLFCALLTPDISTCWVSENCRSSIRCYFFMSLVEYEVL